MSTIEKQEIVYADAKVASIQTDNYNGKFFSLVFFEIKGECVPVDMVVSKITKKQVLYAGERVKVEYKYLDHKIKLKAYTKSNGKGYTDRTRD